MKPVAFAYERPETVEEALDVLAEHGPEAKVLAGGQSLVPALNMRVVRPAVVVDINRVVDFENDRTENGSVGVDALVRQADARLREIPLVAEALPCVGHFVTRNRGTVCGSIAHADPAAELPLALVVLGGAVRVRSARSSREIPAAEFFRGHFTTALAPDELVVETVWPRPAAGAGWAFAELAQRHGDFALCTAAAVVRGEELSVGVGSVTGRPVLLAVDPDRPGESAAEQVEPFDNLHASASYQRHLVRVLVDRVVAEARRRAEETTE
jgi:CO/xanthine dehydrogenase FAD-binding subunit